MVEILKTIRTRLDTGRNRHARLRMIRVIGGQNEISREIALRQSAPVSVQAYPDVPALFRAKVKGKSASTSKPSVAEATPLTSKSAPPVFVIA